MPARRTAIVLAAAVAWAAALAPGCGDRTDHEAIDRWLRTANGAGKLAAAVADPALEPDLAAHAAANLVRKGGLHDVRARLEALAPERRAQVIERLAPRLWDLARVEADDLLPAGVQVTAKDALVMLRGLAGAAQRRQLDAYMLDWYAVASYQARAPLGLHGGAAVMRMIGPPAAKKLLGVLDAVLAAPADGRSRVRIHEELLLGLAATGDAEAARRVLELTALERGDPTLGQRAVDALIKAYVNPRGLIDVVPPAALEANLGALIALAKGEGATAEIVDDAVALIRAIGPPRCVEVLTGLVPIPHRSPRFKYVAAVSALGCGGVRALAGVVRALPDAGRYDREELAGSVVLAITQLEPPDQVRAALRPLLDERSTVARWVAIEALAAMKSAGDAPAIARLAGSRDRLVGYWGAHDPARKPDPTLGQRARELADALAVGAPGGP